MRQHLKQIGKDSAIYSISELLTKAVGILLIPIYTRYLTQADYGIISLISPFIGVLIIFINLGMRGAFSRFYFDHEYGSIEQKKLFGNIILFTSFFGFIICLILTFFGEQIFVPIFPNVPFYPFVFLTIWTAYFGLFYDFKIILYKVRVKSAQYGIYSFLKFLFIVLFTIYAVVLLKKGAIGKIFSEFAVTVAFGILSFILLIKDIKFNINFKDLKKILQYSLPLVPHLIAAIIANFSGRFFINYFDGLEETAIFNIGFLLGSIMQIIVTSINNSWVPFFTKKALENKEEDKLVFSKLITYYTLVILLIGMVLIFFSKEAILVLGTKAYLKGASIIPIIVISYIFNGFYFMAASGIMLVKKAVKYLPLITISATLINILLNWILVPKFGIVGSAFATLGYLFVMFVATFTISQRVYYIPYQYRRILTLLGIFALYVFTYVVVLNKVSISMLMLIPIKIFVLVSFLFLLYMFRFFNKSEISNLRDIIRKVKVKYSK